MAPETGSLERVSKTEWDAGERLLSISALPTIFRPQASFLSTGYSPAGIKREHPWEDSGTKKSKGTLGRQGSHPRKHRAESTEHISEGGGITLGSRKELCVVGRSRLAAFLQSSRIKKPVPHFLAR